VRKSDRTESEAPKRLRCAIYTRKSTEEGLDQDFNSLDAQREAAEAFVLSQRREGWVALPQVYNDGGFTGANMDRPALTRLLQAAEAGELDCVVVYKVDRLSRSLLDFTRMLSIFEKHNVSFVAVTQQFNTNTSLGRLTLNILLSRQDVCRAEKGQVGGRNAGSRLRHRPSCQEAGHQSGRSGAGASHLCDL
jgi:site-specific DNA recombinase